MRKHLFVFISVTETARVKKTKYVNNAAHVMSLSLLQCVILLFLRCRQHGSCCHICKINNDFILLKGDIIFDVDCERFIRSHKEKGIYATIFTHPNNHPYDSRLVETNQEGIVTRLMHKEDERTIYKNRVNAGIYNISVKLLEMFQEAEKTDFDRDILKKLIPDRQLAAY